jgi:2-iminobutanoate/2-iminopropanoate deaminase
MVNLKKVITSKAPIPVGAYSQAIKAGPFLFCTGQIPINPLNNKIVEETISAQTKQVFNNIEAILSEEGLTLENVVKVEVYLKDLLDFKIMNEIYEKRFSFAIKPARVTIQAAKLPLDVLIEISCTAYYD